MKHYLKNMTNATLSIAIPEINFRRTLAPNRQIEIDEKIVAEINYDPGAADMLEKGVFLIVNEEEARSTKALPTAELVALGRERGTNEALDTKHIVLSQEEALKIVREGSISEFTSAIKEGISVTRQNLQEAVITLQKLDPVYVKLIKDYCSVDILQAVTLKSQMIENQPKA